MIRGVEGASGLCPSSARAPLSPRGPVPMSWGTGQAHAYLRPSRLLLPLLPVSLPRNPRGCPDPLQVSGQVSSTQAFKLAANPASHLHL